MADKSTQELFDILKTTRPKQIDSFIKENGEDFISDYKPFADYLRELFDRKDRKIQDVLASANISPGYGYKILSQEKTTKQRDLIIRICLAGHFDLNETQHALQLYGMSPLYPRDQRDAILIIAFNRSIYITDDVDNMLEEHGFEKLYSTKPAE